jgi:hypothetical protein
MNAFWPLSYGTKLQFRMGSFERCTDLARCQLREDAVTERNCYVRLGLRGTFVNSPSLLEIDSPSRFLLIVVGDV